MNVFFVYITTKDKDEAIKIGRRLVQQKLAACINVIDKMTSVYWWEGKLAEDNEAILIAKTTEENVEKLTLEVKHQHSYKCPCVVAFKIEEGNKEYLKWIVENCHI